jgi:Flp pilus assembly pilin Flp
MKRLLKRKRAGQTIVEYILIIALVAIASLTVLGLFSDTLRKKISGIISTLTSGTEATEAQSDVATKSEDLLKNLDETGTK